MAGGFDPIDPERCEHYAGFASHLDRTSFDFIYWFLFALVIGMLFLASWKYSGDLDKINLQGLEPGTPRYRNIMTKCMVICGIYSAISVVAVVMEVYALMALQFCDGEDLMPLYWSTWTMMQVGSVIAILGIMLAVFNSLRGRKNPPWALALGTPVLVVAGIGHAVHGAVHRRVKKVRSRSRGRRRAVSMSGHSSTGRLDTSCRDVPMSREQTLRADDSEKDESEISAKFLGFTPDGNPIMKFADDDTPRKIECNHGVVVGRGDGHVIIAFKKAMTIVNDLTPNNNNSANNANSDPTVAAERPPRRSLTPTPNPPTTTRTPPASPRSPVVRIVSPPELGPDLSPV
ncbi:hypothetical protein N657DRAFT_676002 [Parathielavia appendiculata]|uniref:Uncharacterized protein n=1 Tax=Parathielavia appendiculata TaxID=2587402 RepID=A0AAN6UAV0_9PEZI|nr:hypothetical protein N657DRAFT_676002 [Parathielavia appendiculata]